MSEPSNLVVNGWTIFFHPLFLDELESLIEQVENLKFKDPEGFSKKNATKRLKAISRLAFYLIPQDPTISKYRQGETLGGDHKHWFRAKFFQQYRLFFRFDSASKVILYAWVNDEKNKRAYVSKTDAYLVFKKMLDNGNPPNNWDELLTESKAVSGRFNKITNKLL